jgi:hypothetical protein
MIQYGLKIRDGWLPRDAAKRHSVVLGYDKPLETPDLWQSKERAEELAAKYHVMVVKFSVGKLEPYEDLF